MRRAGNAGIVIPHRLLATPFELFVRKIEPARNEGGQILLDAGLILRRRRHDLGVRDGAVFLDPVTVIKEAARCFRGGIADTGNGRLLRYVFQNNTLEAVAKEITLTNKEDGVALTLEKLFL